nr:16S rRNA processing protein RimM [candidate division Zixibacteria bacterium]
MSKRPEYIVVGRFGRPRGVSGDIYVVPLSDNPERFEKGGIFWIDKDGDRKELEIASFGMISGKVVARVKGIDSPEQARKLTGLYVHIKGAELEELPEGNYYYFDLIGCRVEDIGGKKLGEIIEVEYFPANDIWVVEGPEGKRHMFPAVRQFIEKVDIEKKLVILNPPEGIFDSPAED